MTIQPLALRSVGMPDRDSYSGLTKLCERYPTISIVVLSGRREEMLGALHMAFGGSMNAQAAILARDDGSAAQPNDKKPAINRSPLSPSDLGLTERQLEVLALMMQGKSNKAICRVLNLAEPTVKNHVTAILRALKVSNRTEAVLAVGELGWKLPTTAQLLQPSIPRPNSNVAARVASYGICLGVALTLGVIAPQAHAQNSLWDMNSRFDQGIDNLIARQRAALAAQQAQIRAAQMRAFGPQLIQEWHESGLDQVMTFEQFRYQKLISRNGADVAGALQALRQQDIGNRTANQTLQQRGDILINGMREGSARQGAAVNSWIRGAIRGQGQYIDPVSADIRTFPYYAPGQMQNRGGVYYYQDQDGKYYRY